MIKKCKICGKEFETITYGGSRQYCFDCVPQGLEVKERTIAKRRAAKHQAVLMLGGKCEKCGEQREHILAFHHIDGNEKDENPSRLLANSKIEDFFIEINKCILLCHNCHGDFHFLEGEKGITIQDYLGRELPIYNNNEINHTYEVAEYFCKECGKKLNYPNKNNLCKECFSKKRRKVERPTKEELQEMLINAKGNFTAIGKQFGVTDNTIRKWCKGYDLPYHSSDYK